MDSDLIRLILVALGVLLVIGIYLWDRYKRRAPRPRMVRQAPTDGVADAVPVDGDNTGDGRREPRVESVPETVPHMRVDEPEDECDDSPAQAVRASALDPEPVNIGTWGGADNAGELQFSMDLNFDAHADGDYLSTDPALYDEVERKLVVLNLVATNGEFRGGAIEKACIAAQLRLGEMAIFHRHDGVTGKVLFSVANLIEPGSFPVDKMANFSTPGLSLFTQLPGARDGLEIFEQMLDAGRQLASLLHGELRDERHNKLTKQMERHIAESIIEHRRRLRLTRSRH